MRHTRAIHLVQKDMEWYREATENRDDIIAAARRYLSAREVIRVTGHSANTIRAIVHQSEHVSDLTPADAIERLDTYRRALDQRDALIIEGHAHGMTYRDIADLMGVGVATLHRVIDN